MRKEKFVDKLKEICDWCVETLGMEKWKLISIPFAQGAPFSIEQCPKIVVEKEKMVKVPYETIVGNLMYAIVCTNLDLAHALGLVSIFMSNLGLEHWVAMKRIFRYHCRHHKTTLSK